MWASLRRLRLTTMRWAVGGFCTIIGALMLIVPHQFIAPTLAFVRPILPWSGIAVLMAGAGLLLAAMLRLRRSLLALAHGACGALLLLFAIPLLRAGSLAGGPIYLSLGLGTILSGLLALDERQQPADESGDFFALVMGVCASSVGGIMLAIPGQFVSSIYDGIRPGLWLFGWVYLLGGLVLSFIQFAPPRQLWRFWLPHAVIGIAFLCYMMLVSFPTGGITGIIFYGGFGLLLLLLPWVGTALARLDVSLLRVRLSLTLVVAVAIPLTVVVALITAQQEPLVLAQTRASRELLASSVAHGITDYMRLHHNAVVALAGEPGLLARSPAAQQARLEQVLAAYPDFFACGTFAADGRGLARSDGRLPDSDAGVLAFPELRGEEAAFELRRTATGKPLAVFAAPVFEEGSFAGVVSCGLGTDHISTALDQLPSIGNRNVYLVDTAGRVIVSMGARIPAFADLTDQPPVQALRGATEPGTVRFGPLEEEMMAGYAPLAEFGWGVVVERPLADDLRGVRSARELAFGLLILAISLAAFAGIFVANRFIAPLNALASAVTRFAAGDAGAPLPHQSVNEVARVSAAFDQMRRELSIAAAAREEAISQRDSFFSVAAHELKTPLTALLGQAQLLQRRARRDGITDERNRRSIDVIAAQAERLSRLINDLLDISRLQQGHLTLARERMDFVALVNEVVDEIYPTVEHQSISYANLAAEPLMIYGDPLRLEQVLHNLINNALKYSGKGDEVSIRVERDGPWAKVQVSDTGIGIPADALPRLFERHYRAPNVVAGQISGMGVGLYIVREIVAMHGGKVEAQSVEGEGSTFSVMLPLADS